MRCREVVTEFKAHREGMRVQCSEQGNEGSSLTERESGV